MRFPTLRLLILWFTEHECSSIPVRITPLHSSDWENLDNEERAIVRNLNTNSRAPLSTDQANRVFFPFTTAAQFLKALQRHPHIQKYVKRVELQELNKVWMKTDAALGDMLKILSSSTISLCITRRLSFRSAGLHDLLFFQHMTSLEEFSITQEPGKPPEFADQYTIARFCNTFPSLRILDLIAIYSGSSATADASPPSPALQLETLKIGSYCDDHILNWILPAIIQLKTIHLWHDSDSSCDAIPDIIAGATSLTELHLKAMNSFDEKRLSYVVTPLRQRDSLRTLSLNTSLPLDAAIQILTAFLQLIRSHLFLERIAISLKLPNSTTYAAQPLELLEDIILGPHFPALKWLELHVTTKRVKDQEKDLIKMFPRISEQQKLSHIAESYVTRKNK
ncbi:hypothetical protein BDP27DRAFT_1477717 [Rhodocollybia butyracea]|uniref:Uncharacterized protein n=1 Tax=Rhodocollybia butyracea TaxID=206335 RepID=A0A9P5PKH6_9AGAR|nr:hypothetical protein BDP27DRAFT_1477717 [Rhodocollybia butyracea]